MTPEEPGTTDEGLHGIFIQIEVDPSVATDAALAKALEEACPVDIFAAMDSGVRVVAENQDECVLCALCLDASPEGAVTVRKLYDGTTLER
jgi:NAD-dependent dihydropyrimidine dehydrogenase PreA subunit